MMAEQKDLERRLAEAEEANDILRREAYGAISYLLGMLRGLEIDPPQSVVASLERIRYEEPPEKQKEKKDSGSGGE